MALGFGKDGEMRIVLRVKDDGTAEIEKFGEASGRTAKKSETDWKKIGVAAAAAAAAIGVAAAVMVKQQIDIAAAVQDTADKLGLTTEALSGLQFVADRAGVATQTMDMALQRMTRRLAEAAQGTGEAKDALKDLNLNAADLAKLSPDKQYLAIAEALSKIPTQGERVRLAFKLFDSEGVAVVNTMQRGRRGIEETIAEAQRFGKIISTEFGQQAKQFDENVKNMKAQLSGFANTIANEVLPVLNQFMERISGTESLETLSKMRAQLGFMRSDLAQVAERQKGMHGLVEPGLIQRIRNLDTEIDRVDTRIIEANRRLSEERKRQAANAGAGTGALGRSRKEQEETEKLREALAEQVEAIRESMLSEEQLAREKLAFDQILLEEARMAEAITEDKFKRLQIERIAQAEKEITEITTAEAQKRAEVERQVQGTILAMRFTVWQQAAGLLRAFAGESRAAAIAVIAIEKGLAIAQTNINTQVASMRALADLGPVAGAAAMAKIQALGRLSIALIAAQGLVEAARTGGGGAAPGSFANPVHTTPVGGGAPAFPIPPPSQPAQPSITVIVQGDVRGDRAFIDNVMIPGLQDFFGRDGVLFNSQSRQAVEIVPT